MKNKARHIITFAIIIIIVTYIAHNEIRARHNVQNEIELHSQVVATPLWNLDRNAIVAYVEQIIRNNFYEKLIITTIRGKVFISDKGHPIDSLSDRIFARLKLIPILSLSADVIYDGRVIGQIEVDARIKTIYSDLYALVLGLLFLLATHLYLILLKANRKLDYKVKDLQVITDNVPASIAYVDKDQVFRFANRRYQKAIGYSIEEMHGRSVKELLGEEGYEKIQSHIEKVLSGEHVEFEISLPFKDGITRCLNAIYVPYFKGKTLDGYFALIVDITDRKNAENERRKVIENLKSALDEIKILRGILPICASCKKIRNPEGYWKEIESYIEGHSDIKFSHGICEQC